MKNSEALKIQSAQEENDLKALGIGKHIIREERNENFEDKWLPKLKEKLGDNLQWIPSMYCWRIVDPNIMQVEIIDFYPKANKVFTYKDKKWTKPGLKYLINRYIGDF